jgi:tetratricopeptide (TPR) repeat protein
MGSSLSLMAFIAVLAMAVLPFQDLAGCTIVTMAKGDQVLIGNNEDWTDPQTKMWFYPAVNGEYGRVCFGFSKDFSFAQGGINDQGLFLDANALPPPGWRPDPSKPLFEDNINDHILAHCATVDDAIAFFNKYSVYLNGGKFVIADALGNSIVVEWTDGADRIIRRTGFYQLSTNILQSSIVPGKVSDDRYNIAERVILNKNEVSLAAMRAVLSATHKEWSYPTIYSYICDLKKLRVYVYNFHDFEEAYEFDLTEELKKGKRSFDIPALFGVKTFAAVSHENYATKLGIGELRQKIETGGLEGAIRWYDEVKDKHEKIYKYSFFEGLIQQLGLDLLNENKNGEALAVFKFNAHAHPESADVWEQLGDAFMKTGDRQQARENYEKSLQVNPQNTKVKEKLKPLRK